MSARDIDIVRRGFELVLAGLGVPNTVHTIDTADRAARAWFNELCAGLGDHALQNITTFTSDEINEMVVLRGIPVRSVCAHHLLPFIGEATVAYIPARGEIVGLSKLSRIVDHFARRPQVQEELTKQIADFVAALVMDNHMEVGGVGVAIRANHMCMQLRGVNHSGDMVTSALRGVMRTAPEVRAEFLSYVPDKG